MIFKVSSYEEKFQRLLLCAIVLFQTIALLYQNWSNEVNITERAHVGAAVYFYQTYKHDSFIVNAPLSRMISGVALKLLGCKIDLAEFSPNPLDRSEWALGKSVEKLTPPLRYRIAIFIARSLLIPIILLGSFFGYRWSSELFGRFGGMIFLTLWSVSPLLLGWGATLCPDACAASTGIIGTYFFWRFLKSPSLQTSLVAGLTLGVMILSKPTWLLAFILYPTLWLISYVLQLSAVKAKTSLAMLACLLILGLWIVNAGYFFRGTCSELGSYTFCSRMLSGNMDQEVSFGNRFHDSFMSKFPVPLPSDLVRGLDVQKRDFERGFPTYFLGTMRPRGDKRYYFYVLMCKEPTCALLLCALGAITLLISTLKTRSQEDRRRTFDKILPTLFGGALFAFVSFEDGTSIPRYLLPALPFFYLTASSVGLTCLNLSVFSNLRARLVISARILCVFLAVLTISESVWQFPHSFSFYNHLLFNESRGFYYILDSAADWRQCNYYFADYCRTHGDRFIYASFVTDEDIDHLDVRNVVMIPHGDLARREQLANLPHRALVAVSVNDIYNDPFDHFASVRDVKPITTIGGVLRIYEVESILTNFPDNR